MFRSFSSKKEIHRKKKKKETMLPQQIAFMFSVIKPPADPTIKRRIETFFETDLHLKMEKADTDKDWSFLNKLADRGFMDAMKYHRKGVGDVIKLPFFDKWLIQYESAMKAFEGMVGNWSDLNDELKDAKSHASSLGVARLRAETECKKLKEEIEILKKSNESYEDLLAGNKGLIEKNKKLTAELAEAHSEWKKEGESRLFENKKLKEELDTALEELETALDEGQDLVIEKLEEENEKLKEELAGFKKNMRAVLNMIEYTIGGGSDVSMKINDILWSGGDTFYEKDE
jgi:hypothetical protein